VCNASMPFKFGGFNGCYFAPVRIESDWQN